VYTGGNPISRIDPDGRWWQVVVPAVVIGVGAYFYKQCLDRCNEGGFCPEDQDSRNRFGVCVKYCTDLVLLWTTILDGGFFNTKPSAPSPTSTAETIGGCSVVISNKNMRKTGFLFYFWALVFNVSLILSILSVGGISGLAISPVGWIFVAQALYLIAAIYVISRDHVLHPFFTWGLPCVVILLLGYEIIYGPSLNLITLVLLVVGRIFDIRGRRGGRQG